MTARPKCDLCGNYFDKRRRAAGYRTCLKCGDKEAKEEADRVRERVAIPYNKGPYMLIAGDDPESLGRK